MTIIEGSVTWGHSTGVVEDNTRTFAGNWTGSGEVTGSDDAENLSLVPGRSQISEIVNTGVNEVELSQNTYDATGAENALIFYQTSNLSTDFSTKRWIKYTTSFMSEGYVRIKLETNKWLQLGGVIYLPGDYTVGVNDVATMAKFDLVAVNRFNHRLNAWNWFSDIKTENPGIEIYPYQQGAQTNKAQDSADVVWANTINRWNISRGHTLGALNDLNPKEVFTLNLGGATGGDFKIGDGTFFTSDIAYNATAATIRSRLDALFGLGVGYVVVESSGSDFIVTVNKYAYVQFGSVLSGNFSGLTGATSPSFTLTTASSYSYNLHAGWFLLKANEDIVNPMGSNNRLSMLFNNDVADYWLEATETDIIGTAWEQDGVFVDNCGTYDFSGNNYAYLDDSINSQEKWNAATIAWTARITLGMNMAGQKVFANRTRYYTVTGKQGWIDMDAENNPPDVIMEEGWVCMLFGSQAGAQYKGGDDFDRFLDTIGIIEKSKIQVTCHTKALPGGPSLETNRTGISRTFEESLWYSICCYHLARKDNPNNLYFFFTQPNASLTAPTYQLIQYFDEYEKMPDLGLALSSYEKTSHGGTTLYKREFEDGLIIVNERNSSIADYPLGGNYSRITTANWDDDIATLPIITQITIEPLTGEYLIKR